jgi:hypothetical protein
MNLEIDKRMNSAWAEFGLRLGTIGPAHGADTRRALTMLSPHPRVVRRCGGAAMGGGTVAPVALIQRNEHEGSQEKAPSKVRVAGSHRASRAMMR